MSRSEHPFTGEPVLVDRAEAREILSVTDATFARLCREGRFENMVCEGRGPPRALPECRIACLPGAGQTAARFAGKHHECRR
jgi:hypothetical protein